MKDVAAKDGEMKDALMGIGETRDTGRAQGIRGNRV